MSNSNLDAALSFLQRFPNAKLFPAMYKDGQHKGYIAWGEGSSGDPAQIRAWAEKWPRAHFCCNHIASGTRVVDVDVKKGKRGDIDLDVMQLANEDLPPTLKATTPSGGIHLYFEGSCAVRIGKLMRDDGEAAKGIDIPVMTPVPGSVAKGKGEYKLVEDLPIAKLPCWFAEKAGEHKERDPNATCEPEIELDLYHNVKAARDYLREQPEIQIGERDVTLYRMACRVRDYGVSEEVCLDLMLEEVLDKSNADSDMVEAKVESAYRRANSPIGNATAEAAFKDVVVPEEEKPRVIARPLIRSSIDLHAITPREWILGTRYIRKFVTVTVAPGGGSKSTLVMTEMMSIALNKPLTGIPVHVPGAVWIMNSEDPEDEVHRRIRAVMDCFQIPLDTDYPQIHISGSEFEFCLAEVNRKGKVIVNQSSVKPIEEYIRDNNILVWTLDPLVRTHQVQENDSAGMDILARTITAMCRRTNSCASIVHHTRKGADVAGNMDAARGSGALVAAARIADTLTVMTEKEAEKLGVDANRRTYYVKLDGAKANLRPPAEDSDWFERINVKLPTGDNVGALKPVKFDVVETMDPLERVIIDEVFRTMRPDETRNANEVAGVVHERIEAERRDKAPSLATTYRMILDAFKLPVEQFGMRVRHVKERKKGVNGSNFLVCTIST